MRHPLSFFLYLCFLPFFIQGQQEQFEVLTTNEGLISNHIDDVLVDQFGFLWLASYDGVQKWDGLRGAQFTHQPADVNSLPDNISNCLHEDQYGNIWIGTLKGLCVYLRDNQSIQRLDLKQEDLPVNTILALDSGSLLVGTSDGLCLVDPTTFRVSWPFPDLSHTAIFSLSQGVENTIWVGTLGHGLYVLNLQTQKATTFGAKAEHAPKKITRLLLDHRGRLWLGSFDQGVQVLDPTSP